jgi:prefoldin subunit 5
MPRFFLLCLLLPLTACMSDTDGDGYTALHQMADINCFMGSVVPGATVTVPAQAYLDGSLAKAAKGCVERQRKARAAQRELDKTPAVLGFDPVAALVSVYSASIYDEMLRFRLNPNQRLRDDAIRRHVIKNKAQLLAALRQMEADLPRATKGMTALDDHLDKVAKEEFPASECGRELRRDLGYLSRDVKEHLSNLRAQQRSIDRVQDDIQAASGNDQGDALLGAMFGTYGDLGRDRKQFPQTKRYDPIRTAAERDRRLAQMPETFDQLQRNHQSLHAWQGSILQAYDALSAKAQSCE